VQKALKFWHAMGLSFSWCKTVYDQFLYQDSPDQELSGAEFLVDPLVRFVQGNSSSSKQNPGQGLCKKK